MSNEYPFASMRDSFDLSAYFVVGPQDCKDRPLTEVIDQALHGGATFIQLRAKGADASELTEMARAIAQIIEDNEKSDSVAFVIDDRADVVWQARRKGIKVDGVHIGQEDLPVPEVRRLVGPDMLIGLSTHTPEQAVAAVNAGADYIGVGPIFATQTKEDVVDPVGFEYLEWVARNIELPFVAIGGIKEHNIADVARHGARCCALVSELVGAQDIHAKVEAVRRAMKQGLDPDGTPAAR